MGDVFIGTSGWHYKHWKGPFYPEKLPASRMLEFYTHRLLSVELNNTFYRLPTESAVDSWRDGTPDNFLFALKGSRFLTHMKKLKDPEPGIAKFFERADRLERKLGPIIFQLPPWWEANAERLDHFLSVLPKGNRYSLELRNPSWHTPEILGILRRHNAAYCIFEIAGQFSGIEITADFTYIRLHGPATNAYQGNYSDLALAQWAERLRHWRSELKTAYIYFDNDQDGYAICNALALQQQLS